MTNELMERSPEQIEREIAQTRASLDRKLLELERRFSPREQLQRLRRRLDPEALAAWAAVGAVATGAYLAFTGLRRHPRQDGTGDTVASTLGRKETEASGEVDSLPIVGPCP